jgi:hypothetical protein
MSASGPDAITPSSAGGDAPTKFTAAAPKGDAPPTPTAAAPGPAAPTFQSNKKPKGEPVKGKEEKPEKLQKLDISLSDSLMKILLAMIVDAMHRLDKDEDKKDRAEEKRIKEGKPPSQGLLGKLVSALMEAMKDDTPDKSDTTPKKGADEPAVMTSPSDGATPPTGEPLDEEIANPLDTIGTDLFKDDIKDAKEAPSTPAGPGMGSP